MRHGNLDVLRARHLRFIELILAGYTAGDAYREIRPQARWAAKVGYVWLKNPKIAAAIKERTEAALARRARNAEAVLDRCACLTFVDPAEFFDDHHKLRNIRDMPLHARCTIASFEVREDRGDDGKVTARVGKIRLQPVGEAREQLMRHLGLFEKDHQQSAASLFANLPAVEAQRIVRLVNDLNERRRIAGPDAVDATGNAGGVTH